MLSGRCASSGSASDLPHRPRHPLPRSVGCSACIRLQPPSPGSLPESAAGAMAGRSRRGHRTCRDRRNNRAGIGESHGTTTILPLGPAPLRRVRACPPTGDAPVVDHLHFHRPALLGRQHRRRVLRLRWATTRTWAPSHAPSTGIEPTVRYRSVSRPSRRRPRARPALASGCACCLGPLPLHTGGTLLRSFGPRTCLRSALGGRCRFTGCRE